MTGIRDFIDKIITNPAFLIDVNWLEETNCFDDYRIKDIIMNIADEHICGMVIRYIITSWYDTCELILDGKDDFDELVYKRFWDTNGEWKYVPIEDDEDYEYELPSIEDSVRKILKARNNAFKRKAQKQKMDAKAREKELNQKSVNKCGCIEAMANDNLFSNHYYNEYNRFQDENAQLKAELEKYKSDSEHAINKARIEGIRSVVEQLIIYGEKFPCNQNDKAEVIKEALLAKSFNGHIPSDALSHQWKERLMNLGRKEQGVTFQGESMFNISGNDQVNIGGNNGRK